MEERANREISFQTDAVTASEGERREKGRKRGRGYAYWSVSAAG